MSMTKTIEKISDMYLATTLAERLNIAECIISNSLSFDKEHEILDIAERLKLQIAMEKLRMVRLRLENEMSEAIEAEI